MWLSLAQVGNLMLQVKAEMVGQSGFLAGLAPLAQAKREDGALDAN